MQTLHVAKLSSFVKRFGSFVDGEFRSIQTISPTQIKLTLACQDSARGYDWLCLEFYFFNVVEASLIDNNKLLHVEMCDGISLTHKDNNFTFKTNNATLKIVSSDIRYQETQF